MAKTTNKPAFEAEIEKFKKGFPKYIISSHEHVEHIGANYIFGKEPVIIGHNILRKRMKSGIYLFDEIPDEAIPDLTFSDSMSIYFNGEEIKLIAFPGGHTDNDIIVWFTKSKVVYVGAVSNGFSFPSVDASGDVMKYPEIAEKVLKILPQDVKIIPGHGADCSVSDLKNFHKMLVETFRIVKKGLDDGKSVETMKKEKVLKDWESFGKSYTKTDDWIDYIVEGYKGENVDNRKTIYEPMYYAIKEKGVEKSIEFYAGLKKNKADEYRFVDEDLGYIAYKLYTNKNPKAYLYAEFYLSEYPDAAYKTFFYRILGKIYTEKTDKKKAISYYKKYLKLKPEDEKVKGELEKLEKN